MNPAIMPDDPDSVTAVAERLAQPRIITAHQAQHMLVGFGRRNQSGQRRGSVIDTIISCRQCHKVGLAAGNIKKLYRHIVIVENAVGAPDRSRNRRGH